MDKKQHRRFDIVAHPLPVRPSRYRTVLEAARAVQSRTTPQRTPRRTLLDFLKGSQK